MYYYLLFGAVILCTYYAVGLYKCLHTLHSTSRQIICTLVWSAFFLSVHFTYAIFFGFDNYSVELVHNFFTIQTLVLALSSFVVARQAQKITKIIHVCVTLFSLSYTIMLAW